MTSSSSVSMETPPPLSYRDKIMLAPMVRVGTLPMRLLSLRYGADLVYGEEIIDFRIIGCTRIENSRLGTIDFVGKDGKLIFRTCPEERSRVVFQLGTADPERAVLAAKVVEKDVAAIDVNMGCPKSFSVQGGMGAALLKNPEKVKAILDALVKNITTIPVTCKIRVLPEMEKTVELVKIIEATGVAAIGVHGRFQTQRSSEPAHYDRIKAVTELVKIPVIANGGSLDVKNYSQIKEFQEQTGTTSVMLARSAMWNPSVFRKEGKLPLEEVVRAYLRLVMEYGIDSVDSEGNCKYVVLRMQHPDFTTPIVQRTYSALTLFEICDAWGVGEEYTKALEKYEQAAPALEKSEQAGQKRQLQAISELSDEERASKRFKHLVEMEVRVDFKSLRADKSKFTLSEYCVKNSLSFPSYQTEEDSRTRLFQAMVQVGDKFYRSSLWLASKKYAEQAAAVVALFALDVPFESSRELLAFKNRSVAELAHFEPEGGAAVSAEPKRPTRKERMKEMAKETPAAAPQAQGD